MKVSLVTFYNTKYEPIWNYIQKPLVEFCQLNHMELHVDRIEEPYETLTFRKQKMVLEQLWYNDWVIWQDCDILVKDPTFNFLDVLADFEYGKKDFVVSQDNFGMCAGFFAVRNTVFGRQFMKTWDFLGEFKSDCDINFTSPENGNEGDQHTLRCLVHSFPKIREKTDYFSESIISNPNSKEKDKKKSFAHHFFGRWNNVDDILKDMNEICESV